MADDPVAEKTDTPPPPSLPPSPPKRRSRKPVAIVLGLLLIPAIAIVLWVWVALGYTYASGERAGYVQKISKKGWVCKTWEGELAMANLPGTMPQIFSFTVRSDSLAHILEDNMGKQLSITYEQHRGVPTSCFGETEYFVTKVHKVGP